jgi:REP element-mobilizing transposase RayT
MREQLELRMFGWGGARKGAGRKRRKEGRRVSHLRRDRLSHRHPVHVTMRVVAGLPSLRHRRVRKPIFRAIAAGAERLGMRLVHFSVQSNHLHLLVEAGDQSALGRGMKGLAVRIARAVNKKLGRKGALFADRYHAHALKSPREVRNALAYVLNNARKHGRKAPARWIDHCSSGLLFDGWCTGKFVSDEGPGDLFVDDRPITAAPRTWLLTIGWRRHGPLRPDELSGSSRSPFFEPD